MWIALHPGKLVRKLGRHVLQLAIKVSSLYLLMQGGSLYPEPAGRMGCLLCLRFGNLESRGTFLLLLYIIMMSLWLSLEKRAMMRFWCVLEAKKLSSAILEEQINQQDFTRTGTRINMTGLE